MACELGKYQREVIVSPQLQADVFSHVLDLAVCSDVANSIGQYVAITVAQEREKYRKQLLAIEHIHAVCVSTTEQFMKQRKHGLTLVLAGLRSPEGFYVPKRETRRRLPWRPGGGNQACVRAPRE